MFCTNCGSGITGARFCPQCGRSAVPAPAPITRTRRPYLLAIVGPAIMLVGVLYFSGDEAVTDSRKVVNALTAKELAGQYAYNEINADNLFRGRFLGVEGTIKGIGRSIGGDAYVVMDGGDFDVQCVADSGYSQSFGGLRRGEPVSLGGRVAGGVTLGIIVLTECRPR